MRVTRIVRDKEIKWADERGEEGEPKEIYTICYIGSRGARVDRAPNEKKTRRSTACSPIAADTASTAPEYLIRATDDDRENEREKREKSRKRGNTNAFGATLQTSYNKYIHQ